MPKQEYGLQVGNARFKFTEIVSTANGVYISFPIPEIGMHLSLHYPNKEHPNFGAYLRVPGLDSSYTLDLDQDLFSENHLLEIVDSFTDEVENGFLETLDESEILVLPESIINGFSDSGLVGITLMYQPCYPLLGR